MDLIAVPTDPEKIYVSKGERREAAERAEAESYRAQGLTPPQKKKKRNDRRGGKGKRR